MLTNYDNFLEKKSVWEKFIWDLKECLSINGGFSGTNLASRGDTLKYIYDGVVEHIYEYFHEHGQWSGSKFELIEHIKKHMTIEQFHDNTYSFYAMDGEVDYFFYKILGDNKDVELGGFNLKDTGGEYDNIIRYGYGYTKTEYGKLWITNSNYTFKSFEDDATNKIIRCLNNEDYPEVDEHLNNSLKMCSLKNLIKILKNTTSTTIIPKNVIDIIDGRSSESDEIKPLLKDQHGFIEARNMGIL